MGDGVEVRLVVETSSFIFAREQSMRRPFTRLCLFVLGVALLVTAGSAQPPKVEKKISPSVLNKDVLRGILTKARADFEKDRKADADALRKSFGGSDKVIA